MAQPIIKQTVKELVDNAIDSCRCRTSEQDAPTVRVVLRRAEARATVAEGVREEDLDLEEGDARAFSFFALGLVCWQRVSVDVADVLLRWVVPPCDDAEHLHLQKDEVCLKPLTTFGYACSSRGC